MEFKYSKQFQEKIISVALASEDTLRNFVTIIEPRFFTSKICQTAWAIISKIFKDKYVKISYETLAGILAKSEKYTQEEINTFYDVIRNTNNADEQLVIEEVYDFCKQANFLLTINQYIEQINAGKCDWDELYVKLNDVFTKNYDKAYIGVDYFTDFEKHKRIMKNSGREGIVPTGFPIDKTLGGGLGKKEVGIIIAPTGRGKSTLLLNFALGAVQAKKNVLFLSCELSENYLTHQLDKCLMFTYTNAIEFVEIDLITMLKQVKEETNSKLIIRECNPGELTVQEIYNIYKDLYGKGYNFDVIIVDYIGEMKEPKADRPDLAYKKLVTQLKNLAKKIEIPIWTAHQTGKGSHDKPILAHKDISDAFSILRVVDVGLTLSATEDEFARQFERLIVLKNRFGPANQTVNLKFFGEVAKFVVTGDIGMDTDSQILSSIRDK
jgi:replicative DNA helicase